MDRGPRDNVPEQRESPLMTPTKFIASFSDIADDDMHTFVNRVKKWTNDPAVYLSLAEQLITIPANPEECMKLASIFRGMISVDGRTLPALLYIADAATKDREYEMLGIYALAGIRGFLLREPAQHVLSVETFRNLARTPALEINATQCAIAITGEPYPQPPKRIYD